MIDSFVACVPTIIRFECCLFVFRDLLIKNEDNGWIDPFHGKAEKCNLTDRLINETARTIRGNEHQGSEDHFMAETLK